MLCNADSTADYGSLADAGGNAIQCLPYTEPTGAIGINMVADCPCATVGAAFTPVRDTSVHESLHIATRSSQVTAPPNPSAHLLTCMLSNNKCTESSNLCTKAWYILVADAFTALLACSTRITNRVVRSPSYAVIAYKCLCCKAQPCITGVYWGAAAHYSTLPEHLAPLWYVM